MDKYQAITEARKLLELPEQATMLQIKAHYRRLVRKWHPDKCGDDAEWMKMATRIIAAYNLIINYCNQYKYSFAEDDVKGRFTDEEWWFRRFGEGPF